MKRLIFLLAAFLGTLTSSASDFAYLTFELTDGTKTSVPLSSLTFSITGSTLSAGSETFTLSNLSKMYFTTSDLTAINSVMSATSNDETLAIYNLEGKKVNAHLDQLSKGTYIVKTRNNTSKIVVK